MEGKRKRSESDSCEKSKRHKRVMSLENKLKVLDLLDKGDSAVSVGKVFCVNESTIRNIKKTAATIRSSAARGSSTSNKVSARVRDEAIEKMEKGLSIWIEDQTQRKVPLSLQLIQAKALKLFESFKTADSPSFTASRGWFAKFKKRQSLHNIKITGEAASADTVAAAEFPAILLEHIQEKEYRPEQVFNADETGLFWKKMPSRTYVSTEERTAPGFKAAKDRVTLLLCGNASGDFMVKPMMLHRSNNPRALKGLNKQHLPVFWRSNKKAWVTAEVFMDWFNNCFVHEVQKYLASKNLDFKVLLLLDNAPGHPEEDLHFAHPNIEVMFLPPNTTSLIQPMDQGIIQAFKAYYTRRTLKGILDAMDLDGNLTVTECWKKYDIRCCITNIQASLSELSERTLNACWKNLWPEVVNNFTGFPSVDETIQNIVADAGRIRGIGEVSAADVKDLLDSHAEELTEEELGELLKSASEEEGEDEDVPKPKITMKNLDDIFKQADELSRTVVSNDPFLVRSLKFKRDLEAILTPYREVRASIIKKRKQTTITSFFKSPPSKQVSSKPSTSSAPSDPSKPSTSSASIAAFFRPVSSQEPSQQSKASPPPGSDFEGFQQA